MTRCQTDLIGVRESDSKTVIGSFAVCKVAKGLT